MGARLAILPRASLAVLLPLLAFVGTRPACAQDIGLNPDNLSFFEEGVNFMLFAFTANPNQLTDVPVVYDFNADDADIHPRTNVLLTIERQLPNALTIGVSYFGSYDDKDTDKRDNYEDRWAVYGSGVWGRLSGGKVNETVRETTRRWRGTGNAELEFDDVLGTLMKDDLGTAYLLRLSAYTLSVAVDEDGNSDFGLTYERPNKYVDIRITEHFTNSQIRSVDKGTVFDTYAGGLVGQVDYGSFTADVGLGYEHFDSRAADGARMFVSAGLHYKVRRLTLSAEGHWGKIDGDSETSAALGARYDLARGLSLNLGYNYADSVAAIDGVTIQSADLSEFIGSLRYEF